jgi:hypothetical protein
VGKVDTIINGHTPAQFTGFAAAPAIERVTAYVNVIFGETK